MSSDNQCSVVRIILVFYWIAVHLGLIILYIVIDHPLLGSHGV